MVFCFIYSLRPEISLSTCCIKVEALILEGRKVVSMHIRARMRKRTVLHVPLRPHAYAYRVPLQIERQIISIPVHIPT